MYNKKIDKIHNKIDKIVLKGKKNELEYFNYINELISNGDYYLFLEVLLKYYNIDASNEKSVDSFKKSSWNKIRSETNFTFARQLQALYTTNNLYQIGYYIYDTTTNDLIGEIKEIQVISPALGYYIRNKDYSKLMGLIITYLEVQKVTDDGPTLIDTDYSELNDDRNLIKRYELAINYLLS